MIKFLRLIFALVLLPSPLAAEVLRLAATTSFDNSGLADILLPRAKEALGSDIHLIVVGTGQALRLGARGDVDAVIVHSRTAEDSFVAMGHATHRREIMYNDFVLVGPEDDPAGVGASPHIRAAFSKIARIGAPFISRGDDSGTHKREKLFWDRAEKGEWYYEIGAGMGAALNMAAVLDAYSLSDRASWLKFKNKRKLALLYAGDSGLFNQYAYLPVSGERHPHVNAEMAHKFEKWLTSKEAETLINGYEFNGQRMYVFNARPRP